MRILALEREAPGGGRPGAVGPDLLRAEAARVWELYQAGVVREMYFRSDRPDAVLLLECENAARAEDVLNTLPLVAHGAIAFEVIPLVAYPGLARLFAR